MPSTYTHNTDTHTHLCSSVGPCSSCRHSASPAASASALAWAPGCGALLALAPAVASAVSSRAGTCGLEAPCCPKKPARMFDGDGVERSLLFRVRLVPNCVSAHTTNCDQRRKLRMPCMVLGVLCQLAVALKTLAYARILTAHLRTLASSHRPAYYHGLATTSRCGSSTAKNDPASCAAHR